MLNRTFYPALAAALLLGACGGNDSVASAADTAKTTTEMAPVESATTAGGENILKGVPAGKYKVEKTHAYINFGYSHLGFSNPTVGFKDFEIDLTLDNDTIGNSELSVTINVDSIDSRVERFDTHLVGDKMFDSANFPTIVFNATDINLTSADTLDVTVNLTVKETTLPVTLNTRINKAAIHPFGKVPTIGISASTSILRSEFGVGYATPSVGDEVEIQIEVEMMQAE